jgi:hypothetical protein
VTCDSRMAQLGQCDPARTWRCMIHRVARSALSHHSPFLHIFQQAAARAYIRVQCGSNRANAFDTGLGDTSRESFDPISHPRCAFPGMTVFSILTECFQECQTCFPSATLGQFTRATSTRAALFVTSPSRICSSPPCLECFVLR